MNTRSSFLSLPPGVQLVGPPVPGDHEILSREALEFVAALHRKFAPGIEQLLKARRTTQMAYDSGKLPSFLEETREIRASDWTVGPQPSDLLDRRVEITGPVDRKMIINALNSGARVFMADFEDSSSPLWKTMLEGQLNLRDAVRRTIEYVHPVKKKVYRLVEEPAVLLVRPRGLHLPEVHLLIDGVAARGSLVDFGLYFFHNAQTLIENGSGPYFYLPKLEHYREARLWNEVFCFAQDRLGIPQGTIKATVLVETLPASFQLDEILFELKEHSAGLNCGRWDYIFSYIKTLRSHGEFVTPDRSDIGMTQPMMRAYTQRVIQVCHRRGAHAMGGMAAQIPIRGDEEANRIAMEKVRRDKLREVTDGHDGTWVAHPGLVQLAMEVFDAHMPEANQVGRQLPDLRVSEDDLLSLPVGERTEKGVRLNVRVGVQYLEAWISGRGCVPLYNLMEDAATAEISRSQLWQWVKHGASLKDGRVLTDELFRLLLADEMAQVREELGEDVYADGRFDEAVTLFEELVTSPSLTNFLTLPAYGLLTSVEEDGSGVSQ